MRFPTALFLIAALLLPASQALADGPASAPASAPADQPVTAQNVNARSQALLDSALAYLKAQQKPDGGWANPKEPPGITALVLKAFVLDPSYNTQKDDFLKKGYTKLLSYQLDSGGIYRDMLANYNTAIAVSALACAQDPSYKPALDRALAYLKSMQWTDTIVGPKGEKITDPQYATWAGGFGYGRHSRPDLSNTQFALDALHDAGLKPDDPAFKSALAFVTRCQNLSETNPAPWASNDGGFIYGPANGGDSEAGSYTGPNGQTMWRSYGSMTYAGLKSMIYCGVSKEDPRVKAAMGWIRKHWTFDENPGMREQNPANAQHGLFYYFQVMSKALQAYGDPTVQDDKGTTHDWRIELVQSVSALQKPDGSWSGEKRWMEDNPVITTTYIALSLEAVQEDLKAHPPQ